MDVLVRGLISVSSTTVVRGVVLVEDTSTAAGPEVLVLGVFLLDPQDLVLPLVVGVTSDNTDPGV